MGQKYAQIFVYGHFLFKKAKIVSCELDIWHIFYRNKIFHQLSCMCFRERQKHFLSRAWIFSVFRHRLTEIYVGIYNNTVFHFEANKRALKLLKTGKYLLEFDISSFGWSRIVSRDTFLLITRRRKYMMNSLYGKR